MPETPVPETPIPETNVLPLPMRIEEITPAWLTAALRTQAPGVTVRDAEILDVNHGTCTKIRIRLDLDEAGRRAGIPERVILKGGFEPHSRRMYHLHEAEVRGYRDVFPALGLPSPACYFADFDPAAQQGVVIMEDLVARGVTFCSLLEPQSHAQVARRLTILARFHAQTWNSPEFEAGRWAWVQPSLPPFQKRMQHYLQPDVWRSFVTAPRGAAASVRFHDREWAREALDRLVRHAPGQPQVLLHGDTHLGNLYVDPDGVPGFFDPLPRRGSPMRDIAYHIVCALDTADRRRWEGALLQHYLDELARNGVDAPSFDAALREYGAYLAVGYLVWLINESEFQPEAINTACVARFSAAMLDHDTLGLLRTIG